MVFDFLKSVSYSIISQNQIIFHLILLQPFYSQMSTWHDPCFTWIYHKGSAWSSQLEALLDQFSLKIVLLDREIVNFLEINILL